LAGATQGKPYGHVTCHMTMSESMLNTVLNSIGVCIRTMEVSVVENIYTIIAIACRA